MRCPWLKVAGLLAALAAASTPVAPAAAEELHDPWVEPTEPLWNRAVTIGFEPNVSMPIGDFGDVAGIGVGAGLRVEWRAHPNLRFLVRGGWVFHLIKNEINTHELVAMGGVELFVRRNEPDFFWVDGGVTHLRFVESRGIDPLDPITEPSAGFGVGYDGGRFGVRLGAVFPSVQEPGAGIAIISMLTVRAFGVGTAPLR